MSKQTSKDLIHEYLSPNVNLLGRILGYVIKSQAGEEFFELEEKIRVLSKTFREQNDENAAKELKEIIEKLEPEERTVIIRAFSLFFQLVNLAEDDFKITLNKIRETSENVKLSNLEEAVKYAKENGYNIDSLLKMLENHHIQLVWTAHPTEARRLTILLKLRKIYALLQDLNKVGKNSLQKQKVLDQIEEQVILLWQSDDLRESKVQILDEVRTNLFYFDQTLFDIIPNIYEDLALIIKREYDSKDIPLIPQFLSYGSWVGGDRDGHPGVTAEITIQTLLLQKRLCVRKYHETVQNLLQDLSSSINMVSISEALSMSIEGDSKLFPEFASRTQGLNKLEPYRKKLDFIRLKLENSLKDIENSAIDVGLGNTLVGMTQDASGLKHANTSYSRSQELLDDLNLIWSSLIENNGQKVAHGKLKRLITQVSIFGFHLAPLDLRQDAEIHAKVISEIFEKIGINKFENLTKEKQTDIIISELQNPRPLGTRNLLGLSELTLELLKTFEIASSSLNVISPRSIGTYIMSMSTHEVDVYTTMLFMKETGIITIKENEIINAPISIAPLFETKEDLANASKVMKNLYSNPLYRSLLAKQENVQEIMIGYSDSTKDVGFMESNYRLLMAQKELLDLSKEFGIHLRIFHGRGGSVSRGGGPTNEAILSQLPNSTRNMKITEQGEVIGYTYFNPQIAYRHLEQICNAIILHGVNDEKLLGIANPNFIKDDNISILAEIANNARIKYESLVKQNPNFISFYLQFTPLDLIERATIGSRPSRRSGTNVKGISSLRAIPWIFSWMQSRLIVPAFFGLGTALHSFIKSNGVESLKKLYQEWKYFRTLINNLQMILLKTDLAIASNYKRLVTNYVEIFDEIVKEYKLARSCILQISGYSELLDNSPSIQESIKRRNPYVDPLNLIQIELLSIWREKGHPEEMSTTSELRHLLQTVNGIAAGLRNTG